MDVNKQKHNPVVGTYRGKPVKKYPYFMVRCTIKEFKTLIDLKLDMGLSPRQAIVERKIFCAECHGVEVLSMNKIEY